MSKTTQSRETTLAGHPVEYEVRRSEDATEPRIDIDIRGVTVVLPAESEESPEALLSENLNWVLETKRTYERHRERAPERRFEPGATFPYLGDDHEIVVEPRPAHGVGDGEIRLRQSTVDQSSLKRVLENFYRSRAREHLTDRTDALADSMNHTYDRIELRNQRTRWGSCSTNGVLSFNWRLVMAPPDVIDYVVVHELAHLRESGHNDRFWRLVEMEIPEYRELSDWLDTNSVDLIFSKDDL
ncbi:M48 family metallopeptidase [Halobacterium salinarum]|uniref:M48 family metallopeptidase n=1 Tax=Halobacterium salinarum TaxID=2242 RepID=UPI001F3BA027|nr:SprT family zinc-dependent metalloprotease [Halobacterium salinarum]MCF2206376.1 M48 family metallopeptidase [Halobacterium salinarum]MCF2241080.1 M48 family metallopeptidase [Halobacterium salinarum]